VWYSVCESLHLDATNEWQWGKLSLLRFEQGMRAVILGALIGNELRMFSDLACYLQIQWNPTQRLVELGPPTYSIYEQALCYQRFVHGTLEMRLRSLVAARHLLLSLQPDGRTSALAKKLLSDLQVRKKTHVEAWWLRRRILRWPSASRAQALEMFELSGTDAQEIAPFDSCRACLHAARGSKRSWLYVHLSEEFRCRYDLCG
jgi:hypothetical protein